MVDLLIRNIRELVQVLDPGIRKVAGKGMSALGVIPDAWLAVDEGNIVSFGPADVPCPDGRTEIDAAGRLVLPAFCDSHTHLVYAGSREQEFVDRIRGLSYEEIARRGGGIINSVKRLRTASEQELVDSASERIREIIRQGTGAVEIKSGYGLDTASEMKMLKVIRKLKELFPLEIRSTLLAAHAVPPEFHGRQDDYVNQIIAEIIPMAAGEGLADFIDVFCDRGFFTPDNTARLLEAGSRYGLKPKIHANELDYSGGIQVGVNYDALSVDHLEYTGPDEIKVLLGSETMPTLLPGAALFLGLIDPPARLMIDSGLPLALASDFNPGSSPTGNMMLMMALACIRLKMLPEEALHAATINSAFAMGVENLAGSISTGKNANLILTKPVPSYRYLPYAYGSDLIEKTLLNGKVYPTE